MARATHPRPITAFRQLRRIELAYPWLGELAPELQAEAHRLDAAASLEELTQDTSAQVVAALHELTRFLQRLANADLAQELKERAFWRRDEWSAFAVLERPDV